MESVDVIVTAQDNVYKVSFSITCVNNNMRKLVFVMDDIGVR